MNSPVREHNRRVKTIRPWSGKTRQDFASGPEMGYIHGRMASNRKQVLWAAGGSLGLHVLLLFLWAISIHWLPTPKSPAPTPPPIHLEVVKTEETPPPMVEETPTPTPRPFLDTSDRAPAQTPSDHPAFESDQTSVAASERPATGDGPLPAQEGKQRPRFAFDTTAYTPGDSPALASAQSASAPPPKPPPAATPAPLPRVTPVPTPSHTPVPDEEFGLPPPTPTPEDTEPPFDPSFRGPASTMPERPTVASRNANASNAVGFQADQQISASKGGAARQGVANVDSVATPAGRYHNMVVRAISAKWYSYFYSRGDVISLGMVRIHITVDRRGKVFAPKVLSNSSNEALAAVSIQAVMDAPIPPMPPEVTVAFPDGELSMDLTFNAE